jgi:hypothetical protein
MTWVCGECADSWATTVRGDVAGLAERDAPATPVAPAPGDDAP